MTEYEEYKKLLEEELDWPLYFVIKRDNTVPAQLYIKIDGPDGPAWKADMGDDKPLRVTMYSVFSEAKDEEIIPTRESKIPFELFNNQNT